MLNVKVGGHSIIDVTELTIIEAYRFITSLTLQGNKKLIAAELLKEIAGRLGFLINVDSTTSPWTGRGPTLSGGESQRIRLASQVGAELTGVLYILDEPSIGLHQRDNIKLLETLCHLRDIGNTLVVVEHDRETMEAADRIVDIGPGAGRLGGADRRRGHTRAAQEKPRLPHRHVSRRKEKDRRTRQAADTPKGGQPLDHHSPRRGKQPGTASPSGSPWGCWWR